jgi:hypothetical protein
MDFSTAIHQDKVTDVRHVHEEQANSMKRRPAKIARALNQQDIQLWDSKDAAEYFVKELAMAIVTGNVPFSFIENSHLIDACSKIGIPLPSRKQLADKHVTELAAEAKVSNFEILNAAPLIDASSDGLRKKFCEQGAALNNVMALLPGRAHFHDVMNCSDMRKDAEAIAAFLLKASKDMLGPEGDLDRLVGWVLDNTKANWRAMQNLQEQQPKWIMRGCLAHSTNLMIKDFCKHKSATGPNSWD